MVSSWVLMVPCSSSTRAARASFSPVSLAISLSLPSSCSWYSSRSLASISMSFSSLFNVSMYSLHSLLCQHRTRRCGADGPLFKWRVFSVTAVLDPEVVRQALLGSHPTVGQQRRSADSLNALSLSDGVCAGMSVAGLAPVVSVEPAQIISRITVRRATLKVGHCAGGLCRQAGLVPSRAAVEVKQVGSTHRVPAAT